MSFLESSENKLAKLKDKKKELNQKIKSQTEAINLSQKSIEKLTNIVGNYEQRKEQLDSEIEAQREQVKISKDKSSSFQKKYLDGNPPSLFKSINLLLLIPSLALDNWLVPIAA